MNERYETRRIGDTWLILDTITARFVEWDDVDALPDRILQSYEDTAAWLILGQAVDACRRLNDRGAN